MSDWYRKLGVSADKGFLSGFVRAHGPYFSPILPDLAGDPNYHWALHGDGIGTKGILAYLWWRETGDVTVWRNLAQDALVMNTDDLACIGATEQFVFSTILTRNALRIPDEIVQVIIQAVYAYAEWLEAQGIQASVGGGETADMTDVVRTIGLEAVAATRFPSAALIPLRRPATEIHVVGLASYGQATYESTYNSGIGCNGLTAARHLLLSSAYRDKYPETVEPALAEAYQGPYRLDHLVEGYRLGELLLSPTRTYLPLLRQIFSLYRSAIYGVIHCTGGGQRKALKYFSGTFIRKENFLPLPPVFQLLSNRRPWPELFATFNMGHRIELYVEPAVSDAIITLSQSMGIPAQVIGTARPADTTTIEVGFAGEVWRWQA